MPSPEAILLLNYFSTELVRIGQLWPKPLEPTFNSFFPPLIKAEYVDVASKPYTATLSVDSGGGFVEFIILKDLFEARFVL